MTHTIPVPGLALGLLLSLAWQLPAADTRNDALPLTKHWDLDLLKDLGTIVSIRDESKEKNRVVFVIAMKSVSTPNLAAKFLDDTGKSKFSDRVSFTVLKKEKADDKTTKVEAAVPLPRGDVKNTIHKVVIEKTTAPLRKD